MQISVRPEKATLTCTEDGDKTRDELVLDCIATDDMGVLEIGQEFIFAAKTNRPLLAKRQSCDFRVWFRRKRSLTQTAVEKLNLSSSKIGTLGFFPPSKKDDFIPARPASLEATIFVSDELFSRLVEALQVGKTLNRVNFYIEMDGPIKYGWEPDGSRMVWNLESSTNPAYADVAEISLDIALN
jgi:hypothetical protein